MLKLGGNLRNGSSRLGPRSSNWCIPTHQIISACSSVPSATELNNVKATVHKSKNSPYIGNRLQFNTTELFSNLFNEDSVITKPVPETKGTKSTNRQNDNQPSATSTIDTPHNQVTSGRTTNQNLEQDSRIPQPDRIVKPKWYNYRYANQPSVRSANHWMQPPQAYGVQMLSESYSDVQRLPLEDAIGILSYLAAQKNRNTSQLEALTTHLAKKKLNIKNVADILYCLVSLNFVDASLLERMVDVIEQNVHGLNESAVIGSIVTSFGMMRYRNRKLLNLISEWVVKNEEKVRIQDLCALIMTLAIVTHNPTNSEVLFKKLVAELKETDMIKSSEWLDLVWSLTLLNQATPEQIKSVLNEQFIQKNLNTKALLLMKSHKLLNINAAAKLLMTNYTGPLLPKNCGIADIPFTRSKDKTILVESITDALTNLFPSRNHFRTDISTGTGFLLDAEFFLDKKCAPMSVNRGVENTNALRIAVVAKSYREFCIGEKTEVGFLVLHEKLLQAQGYRLLDCPYDEFRPDDKLLTRITYINDRIKSIVK